VNGSAIRATEDAVRRRLAAARTVPGPPDRTRANSEEFTGQNGKPYNTNPVLQAKCPKKGKKANKRQGAHK
jgi:hypothetical protein